MGIFGQWGLMPNGPTEPRGFPFIAVQKSAAPQSVQAPRVPLSGPRPAPASLGAEVASLEERGRELAAVIAHIDGPALSAAMEAARQAEALAATRPSERRRERATKLARKVASMEAARQAAAKEAQTVAMALASARAALGWKLTPPRPATSKTTS